MGRLLISAAYLAYAAFWIRFFAHVVVWQRARRRMRGPAGAAVSLTPGTVALAAADTVFFLRLLMVNPALWLGEWVFHASFILVLLRHLRFFLNPVPGWVWSVQTAGLIAGYVLPVSLVYILIIRLLTKSERYASVANVFLLTIVLVVSSLGLLMRQWFTPNLVDVKLFILGVLCMKPAPAPHSLLFSAHFILVLVLVLFLPTHIFTAPFVMFEARKRERGLHRVMHDE